MRLELRFGQGQGYGLGLGLGGQGGYHEGLDNALNPHKDRSTRICVCVFLCGPTCTFDWKISFQLVLTFKGPFED